MWVNTQLYIAHCFVCVFQFEWQRKQNKLKNRCYVPIHVLSFRDEIGLAAHERREREREIDVPTFRIYSATASQNRPLL